MPRGRTRREDDESAGDFLKRLGVADDTDSFKAPANSESFKADFLERLAVAEHRDISIVEQQQASAAVMDDLLLKPAQAELAALGMGMPAARSSAMGGAQSSGCVLPSPEDLRRVVELFWGSAAAKRANLRDSTLAVEGSFVIDHAEQMLDLQTFVKIIALVQRPQAGRVHSRAQTLGWEAAFKAMDAAGAGALPRQSIARYLERLRRAASADEERIEELRASRTVDRSVLAAELQARVEQRLHERRSVDAAVASLEDAIASAVPLEGLFALVEALAPPLFGYPRFDASWDARTGFVTKTMLCLPLLDTSGMGTPDGLHAPLCLGVVQLINKLPANVTPPAQFHLKDALECRAFLEKLGSAVLEALPKMLERETKEKERMLEKKRRQKKRRAESRSHHRPRHHA